MTESSPSAFDPRARVGSFLLLAIWFGIFAGLVEGAGLLLFQRINWARWGPTLHVSEQIIWISPIVDVILFVILTLILWAAASLLTKVFTKIRAIQATLALLIALTLYDWLTVTARLSHLSCLLLAAGVGIAFSRWAGRHEIQTLRFVRRTFPLMAAAGLFALAAIQGGRWLLEERAVAKLPPATADAPNVLVIVVDTLRADHLSSAGYARPTSPNIDRISSQGVRFANAIATSSWTFPSHASLLTGRYQYEHGMEKITRMSVAGEQALSANGLPTLGEALMRKGYRTGAFSANRTFFTHDLGFGRGFVHFEDYFHSCTDMFVRSLYGREFARVYLKRSDGSLVKRLLRKFGFTELLDQGAEGSGSYGGAFGIRKRADVINREILDWVDRDRQRRPFFAFVNYFDVHDPYGGPRSYPKPAWPQQTGVDQYDDGVKYVDDHIGQLMQELDRRGLTKNTLVVITGDHGESLGQHHLRTHGRALYWELIHVPLVMRYPGHVPAGVQIDVPVTNSSIPATIMELLGGDGQGIFPGPPLSDVWKVPGQSPWPDALSEVAKHNIVTDDSKSVGELVATTADGPMKSVVTTRWHLIVHKQLGNQLYDWVHDPAESNNLINTNEGREVARGLSTRLEGLLARSDETGRAPTTIALRGGLFEAQENGAQPGSVKSVDYYRVNATGGSTVAVEVRVRALTSVVQLNPVQLDPVVSIVDDKGEPYQTCRNPGDDHTPPPGIADPTPDAFDDICINDDVIPGVNTDARLEILVPGGPKSQVELNIRVSDWNGEVGVQQPYQMQVQEGTARSEAVKAAGQ